LKTVDLSQFRRPFVAAVLAAHAGLFLWAAVTNFVTIDEVGHIPAGISYWQTGRFRIYRVNPPLPRMVATLPVLAARPKVDYRHLTDGPGDRPEWEIGRDFAAANVSNYMTLVRLARLPGLLWSLAGAWVVYRWSRDLYGESAACLGLVLWCFEPTILAHAPLVTTDVPAAVAGLASTYAFWRYLRRPSWRGALIAGGLLGVAQLTKFTLLVLYGLWPVLWLVWAAGPRPVRLPRRLAVALQAVAILASSLVVLNLGYGFSGTGRPLGSFRFVSRPFIGDIDDWDADAVAPRNRFAAGPVGSLPCPVPADYLLGIDEQGRDFEGGVPSYLAGTWRNVGWWDYYLYALAVKWPLGLWGLVLLNAGLTISGHARRATPRDESVPWLAAGAIFTFVSAQVGMTAHMRYILPAIPFVLVSTTKLAELLKRGARPARVLVAALLVGDVLSVVAVSPHWLSYFNEAAGGPRRGHDHLLDSNIDWGQDLLNLKRWLAAHPEARPLHLAFFHLLDPTKFGIEFEVPPPGPGHRPSASADAEGFSPKPGYYAVSVNFLRGMKADAPDGRGGSFRVADREHFAYFLRFRPIARAGYSIYIYHINAQQADAARRELGLHPTYP